MLARSSKALTLALSHGERELESWIGSPLPRGEGLGVRAINFCQSTRLDVAAYHCQQSAEKALKGYLTYQAVLFPKTHNLSVLLDLCTDFEPGFANLRPIAEILTPYGSEFRYPGDAFEPERSDVVEAVEMATTVLNFVTQQLPLA